MRLGRFWRRHRDDAVFGVGVVFIWLAWVVFAWPLGWAVAVVVAWSLMPSRWRWPRQ